MIIKRINEPLEAVTGWTNQIYQFVGTRYGVLMSMPNHIGIIQFFLEEFFHIGAIEAAKPILSLIRKTLIGFFSNLMGAGNARKRNPSGERS